MKKVLVIATLMVLGMAMAANAFVLQGVAGDQNMLNKMTTLTWGVMSNSVKPMGSNPGTAAELAIAANQAWTPGASTTWNYQQLVAAAPASNQFVFGLWTGPDYGDSKVRVQLWATNIVGLNAADTYQFVVGGTKLWSGKITATSNQASPLVDVLVSSVPKTTAPSSDALLCTFGVAPLDTPEPGSMLAMFSGLVGLVGFGIRRRK